MIMNVIILVILFGVIYDTHLCFYDHSTKKTFFDNKTIVVKSNLKEVLQHDLKAIILNVQSHHFFLNCSHHVIIKTHSVLSNLNRTC